MLTALEPTACCYHVIKLEDFLFGQSKGEAQFTQVAL
jgi:hypothetical protein